MIDVWLVYKEGSDAKAGEFQRLAALWNISPTATPAPAAKHVKEGGTPEQGSLPITTTHTLSLQHRTWCRTPRGTPR